MITYPCLRYLLLAPKASMCPWAHTLIVCIQHIHNIDKHMYATYVFLNCIHCWFAMLVCLIRNIGWLTAPNTTMHKKSITSICKMYCPYIQCSTGNLVLGKVISIQSWCAEEFVAQHSQTHVIAQYQHETPKGPWMSTIDINQVLYQIYLTRFHLIA